MGGGTSGLFFGTKGSRHEYQYSLFPDRIRKDVSERTEGTGNTGLKNSGETESRSKKQLITIKMVLKKCLEYHAGRISAQQLVDWLSFVTSSPTFRMEQRLRITIVNAIPSLSSYLRHDDIIAFDQVLTEFENNLNLLH